MKKDTSFAQLEQLVYKLNTNKKYIGRIKKELVSIQQLNLADMFLLAYETVEELRSKRVLMGPSMGYQNGLLINYILGLSVVNPIKYNLLFEPFFVIKEIGLTICVGDKKNVSAIKLKPLSKLNIKLEPHRLLTYLQKKKITPTWKFNATAIKSKSYPLRLFEKGHFNFSSWDMIKQSIKLDTETDFINSIALSHVGLMGFILTEMWGGKSFEFEEFPLTYNTILFQEDWISFVSNRFGFNITSADKLRRLVSRKKISIEEFQKDCDEKPEKDLINYLYRVAYFLPAKSHCVATAYMINEAMKLEPHADTHLKPSFKQNKQN
jgi:hypothetical protein